ncbi:hypothetical protein [Streptomyces salyersiae]|uniref:Tail assembly chaperone n=1 Tax=Streptomyces salyersiae TaxID=3075530 RepID=A0ABU2RYZ3_9ACTN|nr:hypothetical protein [Streptomyces sp. DSM 41770]MDT0432808.1 hypothetical protein [Streptomyces sp. DSM 41770]
MTETDVDQLDPEQGPAEAADFTAFFAEEAATRPRQPITLYGTRYLLPHSLPLMFTMQMERVQASEDVEDVRTMLATLYGPGALDRWAEKGMTEDQLGIVLIYSAANIKRPGSCTMQRAAELHAEQSAGKAPAPAPANREQRRKKTKKKGRSSGGR